MAPNHDLWLEAQIHGAKDIIHGPGGMIHGSEAVIHGFGAINHGFGARKHSSEGIKPGFNATMASKPSQVDQMAECCRGGIKP